jgi:hypothetical protein
MPAVSPPAADAPSPPSPRLTPSDATTPTAGSGDGRTTDAAPLTDARNNGTAACTDMLACRTEPIASGFSVTPVPSPASRRDAGAKALMHLMAASSIERCSRMDFSRIARNCAGTCSGAHGGFESVTRGGRDARTTRGSSACLRRERRLAQLLTHEQLATLAVGGDDVALPNLSALRHTTPA